MPAYSKEQQAGKQPKEERPERAPKAKVQPADLLRGVLHHYRKAKMVEAYMALEIGLSDGRRVDALLLRYSRGPVAFEVKVSRSDWLNELKDPTKHLTAKDLAGQLYFVAPPEIIQEGELPPGTGLYVVKPFTNRVKLVKEADRTAPTSVDWEMAARIAAGALRAAEKGVV